MTASPSSPTAAPADVAGNSHRPAAANTTGNTGDRLLIACQKGDLETIQSLIETQGVDPNHSNVIRQSALHICAWWARTDCLRYLLERGASHAAQNTMTGATPLHCSLASSKAALLKSARLASLRTLLEFGADPSQVDLSNRIPLEYLEEDDIDRTEIVAILEEFARPAPARPAVFTAIEERDLEALQEILLKGEDDDDDDDDDETKGENPSMTLVFHGHTPLLRLVQDWCDGRDADESDDDTTSMDHDANDPFYKAAIHTLLDTANSAAISDNDDDDDCRSIIYATTTPSSSSPTAANDDPMTPPLTVPEVEETAMDILCRAIVERYKLVAAWKADPNGPVPVELYHNLSTVEKDPTRLLSDWCATVDRLVSLHDRNQQQQQDHHRHCTLYTPTITDSHWLEIARRNRLDLAGLFARSWKIPFGHVQNRQGMTPLQFAARSGHLEMVQFLLEHYWKTVNNEPSSSSSSGEEEAIRRFVNHADQRGQTALQAAQVNEHTAIVQLLQDY